ncbi:MAG: hypothetical protein WAT66_01240 [Actinomycetota bacterium]
MKRASIGLLIGAAYVVVALVAPVGPVRVLLDAGTPQQPYQWVNPDPLFAAGNTRPHNVTLTIEMDAAGSTSPSLVTPDGQAGLILPPGAFATKAGETKIALLVEPLDPKTIGSPPTRTRFDGNAYRFSATYEKSKAPAVPAKAVTVVFRFPILATKILRRDGETWKELNATPVGGSQQIYADTPTLGTFVAASLPLETEKKKSFPTAIVVSVAAAVVAAIAGLFARLRGRKRAPTKGPPQKQPPRAKRPPPKRG